MDYLPLILVALIRLGVPLSILRWPLGGAVLSIAADMSDVIIFDRLGWGAFSGRDYHAYDKVFDTYYLALEMHVSLRWQERVAKRVSAGLFAWRLAGVIVFELTRIRQVMLFAPNIFENFYLLVTAARKYAPRLAPRSGRAVAAFFFVAAAPKVAQEYIQHFKEFPTWEFFKRNLFGW
jgi:hypothetical protein